MLDFLKLGGWADAWGGGTKAFRALVDNLDQGVYLLDREGRCLAVNRAFRRWLDRPEGELLGRFLVGFWPDRLAQREAAEHQRVLRGERIEKEEEWPGSRRSPRVRVLKVPVQDADGLVCGVLGLLREIPLPASPPAEENAGRKDGQTDETTRRQAWRYELLGRLVSGLLHDLRNLLTLQVNELALAQTALPAGNAAEEHLRTLRKGTDMEAALIDRLLLVVSGRNPAASSVDVNEACAEVAGLLKNSISLRISLELRLRPDLPLIRAGATDLRRVLLNLCFNACDAMPKGGQLLIETDRSIGGAGGPSELRGDLVCLRVRDSGEGMPPEVQARIFEPFFTTKTSGRNSGQGLAIASDLVRQMGGILACSSVLGEGTSFTIWLPVAAADETPMPSFSASALKRILLVESEPSIVLLVRAILEPRGFEVLSAEDGRHAVEIYRRRQTNIDLVLLEHNLPALGGTETMQELLCINPRLRLLLVSATGTPETALWTKVSGQGFLKKPYTSEELVQAVNALLSADRNAPRTEEAEWPG